MLKRKMPASWQCVGVAAAAMQLLVPLRSVAQPADAPVQRATALQVLTVRPNFHVIVGAGGNIAVQTGEDGIVLVNTGNAALSDQVISAIRALAPRGAGVTEVIDTSSDADLVGGNAALRALDPPGWPAPMLLSTQEASNRLLAANVPQDAVPGDTILLENEKTLYFNGEGIEVMRAPAAHSDGDLLVFFHGSDVLVVGDVIDTDHFPQIDVANGGTMQGEVNALNRIVSTAIPPIPFAFGPGGTVVVPGHGRLYAQPEAVQYRDMMAVIRDQVQADIVRHQTLTQIQRSEPALGWETEFGATSGDWTTQDFVAAVYRSLVKQPAYAALEHDTGMKAP
jgi:glyoxylase-like metal-dependent hydrolase (beta-lactamase superfamily II)